MMDDVMFTVSLYRQRVHLVSIVLNHYLNIAIHIVSRSGVSFRPYYYISFLVRV